MEPTAESNTAQSTANNDLSSLASWLRELPQDLKQGIAVLGSMAADLPEALRDRPLYAIEAIIAETDRKVNALLNAIIHHPDFTGLESAWRGLHYLVTRTPPAESTMPSLMPNVPIFLGGMLASSTQSLPVRFSGA